MRTQQHRRAIYQSLIVGICLVLLTGWLLISLPLGVGSNISTGSKLDKEVCLPLARIGDYIELMMMSRNDLIFLNLGAIGRAENHVVLEPIPNGVSLRVPSVKKSYWFNQNLDREDKLREIASSLDLTIDEISEESREGGVNLTQSIIKITGEPRVVANHIESIISRTFSVGSSEVCEYQFCNMPSTFSTRADQQPKTISSDVFVDQVRKLELIYLGEQEHLIFAIPPDLATSKSLQWDSTIKCTDVRQLQPEVVKRVRWTQANANRPNVKIASHVNQSQSGQDHQWTLVARGVAAIRFRLLHLHDGEMNIAKEFILREGDENDLSTISVGFTLKPQKDDPHTLTPLFGVSTGETDLTLTAIQSIHLNAAFSTSPVVTEGNLSWDQPTILFHHAVWDGDLTYQRNSDSMLKASKQGANFIVLEVDWVASGSDSVTTRVVAR